MSYENTPGVTAPSSTPALTALIDLDATYFQVQLSPGATFWVTREQLQRLPPFVAIVASMRRV